jgi:hypothetical protein
MLMGGGGSFSAGGPGKGIVYQVPYQLSLDSYDTRTLSPSVCSTCSWGGSGSFSASGPGKGIYTRYRTNYPLIVMIPGLYRLLCTQHAHGRRRVILRRRPGRGMYTRYRTNYPLIVMIPGLYRLLRAQHAHGRRRVILRRRPRQGHVYQVPYQLCLDSYDTRILSPSVCSTCSWAAAGHSPPAAPARACIPGINPPDTRYYFPYSDSI